MRAEFDLEQFAVAGSSIVSGLANRAISNPEVVERPIKYPGPDAVPVEWTLAAIGYVGIGRFMLEPDPDWQPPRGS